MNLKEIIKVDIEQAGASPPAFFLLTASRKGISGGGDPPE